MLISIKGNKALLTVIAFMIIIVAGEFIIYAGPHHHISADAVRDGDTAVFEFDTDLNIDYHVVSMDNSTNVTTRCVAFYDKDCQPAFYRPDVYESIEWLQKYLKKENVELSIIDLSELTELIKSKDTQTAVLFATGILPYTVYTGFADDPIFKWLEAGGMMYWLGNQLGYEYFDEDMVKHKVFDSDLLFYGHDDVTREHILVEGSIFNNDMISGSFSNLTGQYYNECTFGLDVSKLSTDYMTTEYNYGGYYALTFMKYHSGDGSLVVFGGGLNKYAIAGDTAMRVAQTVACRTVYDSTIIDYVYGANAKGASGSIQCNPDETDVFMYLTSSDVIYGKNVTL